MRQSQPKIVHFRGGTNAARARFKPHPLRICGSLPPNSLTRKATVTCCVRRSRETRMGNRTAKFISALFASVLAGIPLSAESQNAANVPAAADAQNASQDSPNATDDCLRAPKG